MAFVRAVLALVFTALRAAHCATDCADGACAEGDAASLLARPAPGYHHGYHHGYHRDYSYNYPPKPQPCKFQQSVDPAEGELIVTTWFYVTDAEKFKHAMGKFIPKVKRTEPDTWSFTVWLSEDGTFGSTWEQYKDNSAIKGLRPEIARWTRDYQTWLLLGDANDATRKSFLWYYPAMSNLITGYRNNATVPDFTKRRSIINMVRADIFSLKIFQGFAAKCGSLGSFASLYGIYQSAGQEYNAFLEFYAGPEAADNQLDGGLADCINYFAKEAEKQDPSCADGLYGSYCGNGMEPVSTVPKLYMGPRSGFADRYEVPLSGGAQHGRQPWLYSLPESFMRC